jgi:hypothetical protein
MAFLLWLQITDKVSDDLDVLLLVFADLFECFKEVGVFDISKIVIV